jgi:hypothetical protein
VTLLPERSVLTQPIVVARYPVVVAAALVAIFAGVGCRSGDTQPMEIGYRVELSPSDVEVMSIDPEGRATFRFSGSAPKTYQADPEKLDALRDAFDSLNLEQAKEELGSEPENSSIVIREGDRRLFLGERFISINPDEESGATYEAVSTLFDLFFDVSGPGRPAMGTPPNTPSPGPPRPVQ